MATQTRRTTRRSARFFRATIKAHMVVACCGLVLLSAVAAYAELPLNGLPMNGLPINGMPFNGLPLNGVPERNASQWDALPRAPPEWDASQWDTLEWDLDLQRDTCQWGTSPGDAHAGDAPQ